MWVEYSILILTYDKYYYKEDEMEWKKMKQIHDDFNVNYETIIAVEEGDKND